MTLPFSSDDEQRAEIRRQSLGRRKKALALMASGHDPYARLGRNIEESARADDIEAQHEAQRKYDEALRAAAFEAENAHHAQQMALGQAKEAHDVESDQRRFEQQAREFAANERFRRDSLAQQEQLRRETLQQQRELAGMKAAAAEPAQIPPTTVAGEPLPNVNLPGKTPVFQKKAVMDSASAIVRLNRAYKLLQKTPDAYGTANQALGLASSAVGGVPVLGHALGPIATSGTQRLMTREQRQVRNEIDSLVDEAIKTISGGQVTQYEDLRKTYLPRPYDGRQQVEEKIRTMLTKSIGTYKSFGGVENLELPPLSSEGGPDVDSIVKKYLQPTPMRSH